MTSRTSAVAASLLLSVCVLGGGSARAEVSGSLTLVSDYLFRGISQSGGEPALQGGVEYASEAGFYAGAWGSSISWLSDADPEVSSQLELDGYLGYRGSVGESGLGYDVGALYYGYPGDYPPGFPDPDTTEVYLGLAYGLVTAKYSYAVTDLFGLPDSEGSSALDVAANWEFVPDWTLNAAVGRQWVSGQGGSADYAYWKLGATKAFDNGFAIAAALNDNDLIGPDETFTVAVTRGF